MVSRGVDWIPWHGGAQINYNTCTSGFSAYDTVALVHGETGAGHCHQAAGSQVTQGCDTCTQQTMGQVAYWTGGNERSIDFSFVDSSYTGSDSDWTIYSTETDRRTVSSVLTDPAILTLSICTSGARTLENCNATVRQTDVCFQYSRGPRVCHLDMAGSTNGRSIVLSGDSGGPVYRLNPSPFVEAIGVISGCLFDAGTTTCDNGSTTVFFTPFAFTPSRYQVMTSTSPIPPVPTSRPVLSPNQRLNVDQRLLSASGQYQLVMQGDGNLVVYAPSTYLCATWTTGLNNWLIMGGDGNLVMYTASGTPIWWTNTQGNPGAWLSMQDNSDLVIYSWNNVRLWSRGGGTC